MKTLCKKLCLLFSVGAIISISVCCSADAGKDVESNIIRDIDNSTNKDQGWTCENCGADNDTNYCTNCGQKRPKIVEENANQESDRIEGNNEESNEDSDMSQPIIVLINNYYKSINEKNIQLLCSITDGLNADDKERYLKTRLLA